MDEIKIEGHYKKEAKDLTDTLFDKGFLNDNLSREAIYWLEEYLGFIIQSKCQMAAKTAILVANLRNKDV